MEGRHSGVEEYTTHIIRSLTRIGSIHSFHLFYNSSKEVAIPDFGPRVTLHAFRYPNKLLNLAQWLMHAPTWDRLLPVRPDVVFIPSARLTPVSPEIPTVVVAHDLSFELFPEFLGARRRMWHHIMRPRHLMSNADRVIAVSHHTKQDLVRLYGIPEQKIVVIHSGIDQGQQASPAAIHNALRTLHVKTPYILSLNRQEPRKNVIGVVRAFSAIADTIPHNLVLAGEQGWMEKQVHVEIQKSAHAKRIHAIGFIPVELRTSLLAGADLFVYPSFYEGFGFPPLEALLAGTPVVTSYNSSLPEIVGTWATLIDPHNISQLAGAMRELLHHPSRVLASTQQEILQHYSWHTTAQKTLATLQSVV